jgi:asparagine synthase (glutamine-hydrolysing)
MSEGSFVARLLRKGRWVRAYKEIAGENRFWGGGLLLTNSREYVQAAFVSESVKQRFRERRHLQRVAGYLESSLISRDFARQVDIGAHFERMRHTMPGGWTTDYATERCRVIRPSVTAGRERYARLAAAHEVEARDPFLDKRVVDFCSRLPGRLRMRDGWYKIVLRDLMAGRVPEEVRWLRGKPHLGWRFSAEVTRRALHRGSISLASLRDDLDGYIDPAKLEDAWREFQNGSDTGSIHSAHVLSVWLQENAKRPVVPE